MKETSATFWLVIGGLVLGILYLWEKSRAQSTGLQSTGLSNPVASAANSIATKTDAIVAGTPFSWVAPAITSPVTNVTSGNVKGTFNSITSGGMSDIAPSISKYINPAEWFGW